MAIHLDQRLRRRLVWDEHAREMQAHTGRHRALRPRLHHRVDTWHDDADARPPAVAAYECLCRSHLSLVCSTGTLAHRSRRDAMRTHCRLSRDFPITSLAAATMR